MTKIFRNGLIATLAGIVALTSAVAFAADRERGGDRSRGMGAMIEEIDTNSDGAIARAELTQFVSARFTQADTDSDQSLTVDELAEAAPGRRGARFAEHMFPRLDVNGDGTLVLAEVEERSGEMFALMDVDNSDAIEADEMPRRGKHGGRDRGEKRN